MEEEIYQLCLKNSKENPFNHYLDFLKELKELTDEEWRLSQGAGMGIPSYRGDNLHVQIL